MKKSGLVVIGMLAMLGCGGPNDDTSGSSDVTSGAHNSGSVAGSGGGNPFFSQFSDVESTGELDAFRVATYETNLSSLQVKVGGWFGRPGTSDWSDAGELLHFSDGTTGELATRTWVDMSDGEVHQLIICRAPGRPENGDWTVKVSSKTGEYEFSHVFSDGLHQTVDSGTYGTAGGYSCEACSAAVGLATTYGCGVSGVTTCAAIGVGTAGVGGLACLVVFNIVCQFLRSQVMQLQPAAVCNAVGEYIFDTPDLCPNAEMPAPCQLSHLALAEDDCASCRAILGCVSEFGCMVLTDGICQLAGPRGTQTCTKIVEELNAYGSLEVSAICSEELPDVICPRAELCPRDDSTATE